MKGRSTKVGERDLYERFPTQAEKDFRDGKISKMPSIPLYRYWTNFDRNEPSEFQILTQSEVDAGTIVKTKVPHLRWWQFTTNIEPAAFEYEWDTRRQRRFLYKMDEIYNRKKVEAV